MFDFANELWTELPSMQTGRDDHGCGLATKSDGTVEVIVAGGDSGTDTIEILDLATLTWR